MNSKSNINNQTCAICKTQFCCDNLAGKTDCWCFSLPAINTNQLNPDIGCLCPSCLKKLSLDKTIAPIAK
ncbi:cysteine-rich CWC family protein [Polynucleobacter sp. MWH-Spelu-300-X4]|uniref:cysteine-rich CWC family protein n=1 Tax=Polynucleobacter sp. MWH-Spelu-300-X4 TaxID=2689109 RepID=UPI001BFDBC1D|nr:cysteine-rich CWC family protein [Polynucleobacter sp. MWH-Spelu-300-X4]